jgi:hypothetical protein
MEDEGGVEEAHLPGFYALWFGVSVIRRGRREAPLEADS